MQKSAPLTVHYGRELELEGQRTRGPGRCREPPPARPRPVPRAPPTRGRVAAGLPAPARRGVHHAAPPHGRVLRAVRGRRGGCGRGGRSTTTSRPQVRYPVAQEEVHDVAAHLGEHGDELGVDGAGWPSAASARAATWPPRPVSRRATTTPSGRGSSCSGCPRSTSRRSTPRSAPSVHPCSTAAILDLVRATYFRDVSRRTEPYASPLRARAWPGCRPRWSSPAERDLLRREGDAYARGSRRTASRSATGWSRRRPLLPDPGNAAPRWA